MPLKLYDSFKTTYYNRSTHKMDCRDLEVA